LIVARAVAAGVIDRADADLIVASRLDRTPIEQIAAAAGVDGSVLWMRRLRAERALADAVTCGMLSGAVGDDARNQIRRRAAARATARAA
jgi:hypothetical protein